MFGLFKKDPVKKLEKEYYETLEKARDIQRAGDIKAYSAMMAKSEEIWARIEALRNPKKEQ
ncbi:DUF6435 family protein [Flavilitoribacter nigricans]|uniref:Lacal_2735 family protein n=1 Tax=Flavilitoribacter nigricans (strain ATCC 23147 / DSM 23189 / NBRC 102662 / NCIMB 1420 / SS-2) TaxID=1122177 RepID=A0A2D0N2C9_FLAN2|nr:DUF6435 family protein [Flavilitoribacter nigricans]PHN02655.1 hypothetical protein CRP01_31160 [Flavilitoribacter nigricans DSM 23189 = NBRC 102662]